MFVWLSFTQTTDTVIAGCEAAWQFFGGVFRVTEGLQAFMRDLKAQGAIINFEVFADPELNSASQLEQGKVYWNIRFTDSVADIASSGLVVLGGIPTKLDGLDLKLSTMSMLRGEEVDGRQVRLHGRREFRVARPVHQHEQSRL